MEALSEEAEVRKAVEDGLKLKLRLPSSSLDVKISEAFSGDVGETVAYRTFTNSNDNLERNQVTEFDLLNNCIIGGNNNGILSIWDFTTGELLVSKQLFGIITGLKCFPAENTVITTHAGEASCSLFFSCYPSVSWSC